MKRALFTVLLVFGVTAIFSQQVKPLFEPGKLVYSHSVQTGKLSLGVSQEVKFYAVRAISGDDTLRYINLVYSGPTGNNCKSFDTYYVFVRPEDLPALQEAMDKFEQLSKTLKNKTKQEGRIAYTYRFQDGLVLSLVANKDVYMAVSFITKDCKRAHFKTTRIEAFANNIRTAVEKAQNL